LEFTGLNDRQLERLIRHRLKKYPELLKHRKMVELNPNFKFIQERITGPKIVNQNHYSLKHEDNLIDEMKAPGPGHYNADDRILHEKLI
jgi:hypothetical protein